MDHHRWMSFWRLVDRPGRRLLCPSGSSGPYATMAVPIPGKPENVAENLDLEFGGYLGCIGSQVPFLPAQGHWWAPELKEVGYSIGSNLSGVHFVNRTTSRRDDESCLLFCHQRTF